MNLILTIGENVTNLFEKYSDLITVAVIVFVLVVVMIILMIVSFSTDKRKFKDYDEDGFDDAYYGPIEYKEPPKDEEHK